MQILNAFSLNMLESLNGFVMFEEISLDEARAMLADGFESAVGHADTAAVFSSQLGMAVVANRSNVTLKKGDVVLVGQYRGPRLPEGATTLPDGATIVWCRLTVN